MTVHASPDHASTGPGRRPTGGARPAGTARLTPAPADELIAAVAAQRPDGSVAALWSAIPDALGAGERALSPGSSGRDAAPSMALDDGGPAAAGTRSAAAVGVTATVGLIEDYLERGLERVLVVELTRPSPPGDAPWVVDPAGSALADAPAGVGPAADAPADALGAAVDAFAVAHPAASIQYVGATPGADRFGALVDLVSEAGRTSRHLVEGAVGRSFGEDPALVVRFLAELRGAFPPGTAFVLRGSAVLGYSYKTGRPFDDAGPGTSDIDIVAIGDEAVGLWHPDARILGGLNTLPLADGAAWVAPSVEPARIACQAMAGRPVSIQVMARWFLDLRAAVQGQPYVDLLAA